MLDIQGVKAAIGKPGMSSQAIYMKIQRDNFPRPVKIGKASRWSLVEVKQWKAKNHQGGAK